MYATGVYRDAPAINAAMGRVYFHMMCAVLTSMLVSYVIGTTPDLAKFFLTGAMMYVSMLLPLVFIFIIPVILESNPPAPVAVSTLHAFAAAMGLSLGSIFIVYTMGSIFTAFMGAAVLFGVMSLYGYFTKRSLESVGSFCFVGLIAIIIASLINIFVGSTVMQMVISAISILIFLGFTAFDTQQIREAVSVSNDDSTATEIMGALTLYLDFINLFVNLLRLFGVLNSDD